MAPQLVHANLKRHSGAGGVFLEDHGQGFAFEIVVGNAMLLAVLHLVRRIQNLGNVLPGQIQ